MQKNRLATAILLASTSALLLPGTAAAATDAQVEQLQQQIDQLQQQISSLETSQNTIQQNQSGLLNDADIDVGGAVRFQYTNGTYNSAVHDQSGKVAFDTFRLNLDGSIGDVILSAEWRWYEYMTTLHHAWVGYNFDENNQLQLGLTRIPFGVQAYDSHSFFFSSNYYLGLEDTYAFGAEYIYDSDDWNVQAAFFKNRQRGVAGGNDNYSYNLTAANSNGAGQLNTGALRVAYTLHPSDDVSIEMGASGLYGQLGDGNHNIGNYGAYALHTEINMGRWNFQAQAAHYDYRFDNGTDTMILGAYAGNYKTPTNGHTYSLNAAYSLPVDLGPITNLTFYNDYSLVTHKPNGMPSTYMNDTGVAVSAGGVYAYIDYINARNQPFIGGSLAGDGEVEHRFNINIGYYF